MRVDTGREDDGGRATPNVGSHPRILLLVLAALQTASEGKPTILPAIVNMLAAACSRI